MAKKNRFGAFKEISGGANLNTNKKADDLLKDVEVVKKIDITKIEYNPHQPRYTTKEIEQLAESIAEVGQRQPIELKRDGDKYIIISGHRRFEASKSLGLEHIKAIVDEKVESKDYDLVILSLIENLQRMELTALERGLAYKKAVEDLKVVDKYEDLAKKLTINKSDIAKDVALTRLPQKVIDDLIHREKYNREFLATLNKIEDENTQYRLYMDYIEKVRSVKEIESEIDNTVSKSKQQSLNEDPKKIKEKNDKLEESINRDEKKAKELQERIEDKKDELRENVQQEIEEANTTPADEENKIEELDLEKESESYDVDEYGNTFNSTKRVKYDNEKNKIVIDLDKLSFSMKATLMNGIKNYLIEQGVDGKLEKSEESES